MGQMVFNGLVNAALIAPPAVAFTMMFAILRFPNFAIGGYITVGAFAAYTFNAVLQWPLALAAAGGMAVAALVTWLSDLIVFRPMRGHSAITLLVVSIALTLILENLVRLGYGSDVRGFDLPLTRPLKWAGLHMTIEQIYILGVTVVLAATTHGLLRYTRMGKAMRATADNFSLAEVRGINTGRVIAATWLYCGALLGLTGTLAGLDLVIEPLVGWNLTIPIFAAAILGGIGSPYGALVGAVLVGLAEELTVLVLPSTYKVGVGFIIIAILLLFRPHGLFGVAQVKK
ncbi:MAG: branched-chain amino acid ABC transporter permease [Kiloniellaceae bacterium]